MRSTSLIDAADATDLERWQVPALDAAWSSRTRRPTDTPKGLADDGSQVGLSTFADSPSDPDTALSGTDTQSTATKATPDPSELEAIRAAAFDEAYAQGFDQGSQEAAQVIESLQALAAPLKDLQQDAEQRMAQACLQLAIEVARRLVGETLRAQPESILVAIHQVIQAAGQEASEGHLLIHPSALAIVQQHEADLHLPAGVKLQADPSLQPGDCFWQSAHAEIDGRVATRWRAALAELGVANAGQDPGPRTEGSPEAGDPADVDV